MQCSSSAGVCNSLNRLLSKSEGQDDLHSTLITSEVDHRVVAFHLLE